MKCPNCGKETSNEKDYCTSCGYALYGPQSILLNDTEINNNINKNNINSITGIDINSISQNTSAYTPENRPSFEPEKKDDDPNYYAPEKKNSSLDFKWIIIIILLGTIILLVFLLINSKDDSKPSLSKPNDDPVQKVYEGYKVTTTTYSFDLPKEYEYYAAPDSLIIKNKDYSLKVYPLSTGKIDIVTSSTIKEKYASYESATLSEQIINRRKYISVSYSENGNNYLDIYYQFDGERVLYAQGMSPSALPSKDISNILSTFTINGNDNKLSFTDSTFVFDDVLSLLK